MCRTLFWTLGEGEGRMIWENGIETCIIYETNNQSRFDAGYRMLRAGMIQRDGMGREVGGGFKMGNTCTPMADSCQCMAKPLQ